MLNIKRVFFGFERLIRVNHLQTQAFSSRNTMEELAVLKTKLNSELQEGANVGVVVDIKSK
jgi:hypothetical protein